MSTNFTFFDFIFIAITNYVKVGLYESQDEFGLSIVLSFGPLFVFLSVGNGIPIVEMIFFLFLK
jgi:hypothetical protein